LGNDIFDLLSERPPDAGPGDRSFPSQDRQTTWTLPVALLVLERFIRYTVQPVPLAVGRVSAPRTAFGVV
jgi:hypothetical protein